MPTFDRIIVVDWSATSGITKPGPDTIHIAFTQADHITVEHAPTRLACEARIAELVAASRRALVACDFAFGYPRMAGLPTGRALCTKLANLITESPAGVSNRFAVAAQLNREITAATGHPGPFWGRPASIAEPDLPTTQPATPIPPYREVERLALTRLREWGRIQSAFKCAYPASVGSQTLTGLACIGRLLAAPALASRAVLWPFETNWEAAIAPDAIVFAEVWPATQAARVRADTSDAVRDAKQVRAVAQWLLEPPAPLAAPRFAPSTHTAFTEGWILGVDASPSS
ncbi:MAG TPA: hypothetical protein VK157_06200 [Phycisphaerales bacterium]|nr:hypothetical protein [Phycisphaerales bacterium]